MHYIKKSIQPRIIFSFILVLSVICFFVFPTFAQTSNTPTPTPTASAASSAIAGPIPPLTLVVRPKPGVTNTYISNQARAVLVGGGSNGTGTGLPGEPFPTGDVASIKQKLCNSYKVCPTVSTYSPPGMDWTIVQLQALWNVVQKIYQSSLYKSLAIGKYTLEVSRAACIPDACSYWWGYYANLAYPDWNTIPGARLVVLSNNVPTDGPEAVLEWVIAHEIGHSGSAGTPSGDLSSCGLGCNPPSLAVLACNDPVSDYATSSPNEYIAEAISYYMTDAEQVRSGYIGANKNEKLDHPCIYNAVKQGFFDGVEY